MCVVCVSVSVYIYVSVVFTEARESWSPWSWTYEKFWVCKINERLPNLKREGRDPAKGHKGGKNRTRKKQRYKNGSIWACTGKTAQWAQCPLSKHEALSLILSTQTRSLARFCVSAALVLGGGGRNRQISGTHCLASLAKMVNSKVRRKVIEEDILMLTPDLHTSEPTTLVCIWIHHTHLCTHAHTTDTHPHTVFKRKRRTTSYVDSLYFKQFKCSFIVTPYILQMQQRSF